MMAANGRYGLLIIDPHGEHRAALGRHPWAETALRTYSDRRLPNTSTLRISLAELSVDDLRTAYEWSRPQEEALHELERHYSAALPRTEASGRAPRDGRREGLAWLAEFALVEDLAGFRDVELSARVALNTLQVVHRRARRIVELPCISIDPAVSVGRRILTDLLEGKVVLVDVSGLGGTEEVLVASYLTRRVLEEWQSVFLSDPERHKQLPVGGRRPGGSPESPGREQGPRVECVPAGGQRGPEVRRRPAGRDPAAQTARRRIAEPVQYFVRARPGRRERPQYTALFRQTGPVGARPKSRP